MSSPLGAKVVKYISLSGDRLQLNCVTESAFVCLFVCVNGHKWTVEKLIHHARCWTRTHGVSQFVCPRKVLEVACRLRSPVTAGSGAVRSDATAAAIANFYRTVLLRTSSGKRTLISCQLELITRLEFYYYYNPSPSTDFKRTYPQFSIYVQFCHLRYLVSRIRGFKYMHLGKIPYRSASHRYV